MFFYSNACYVNYMKLTGTRMYESQEYIRKKFNLTFSSNAYLHTNSISFKSGNYEFFCPVSHSPSSIPVDFRAVNWGKEICPGEHKYI